MADIYDVQNALATLAQMAVYPNGLSNPSVINNDVRIYPGKPLVNTLDADLTAQKAHVGIFMRESVRSTTRFDTQLLTVDINTPSILLTTDTDENTITVGGSISTPQVCMAIVNNTGYAYNVKSSDTVNSIAENLGSIIPSSTILNNVITITNNPYMIVSRVIVTGISAAEFAREARAMVISVYAANPIARYQLGSAITTLFAGTYRLPLPDGFIGQLKYSGSDEYDKYQKVKLYQRDIYFIFEYAVTNSQIDYTIGDNLIYTNAN